MNRSLIFLVLYVWGGIGNPAIAQVQDDTKIALSGFSVSETFSIEDRKPLSLEEPNLLRLVYRLWQTSIDNLEKYSQYTRDVSWQKLLEDPAGFRLQVFKVSGRIKSVERIRRPEAEDELKFVYRCQGVTNSKQPFEVLSLHCPASWAKLEELDEPVTLLGFFFGLVTPSGNSELQDLDASVPLLLTKQIFWYPVEPDSDMGVTASHTLLAAHGVDIAGFDLVRREDRKALGSNDARTFYQLLAAVDEINSVAGDRSDHMELLRKPTSYGQQVAFRARVRKCSVVRADAVELPKLKQFYQLIVFPDLRDAGDEPTMVEIGKGEEKLAYRRFPFTVCCRELPAGMTPSQIENQQVIIEGFYYRFWQFDAQRTRETEVGAQISPIIIADRPIMIESTFGELQRIFGLVLLVVIGVLGIVGLAMYRTAKRTAKSKLDLPDRIDPPQVL